MKKIVCLILAISLLVINVPQSKAMNFVQASDFATWVKESKSAVGTGSNSFLVKGYGQYVTSKGVTFMPFSTSTPILVDVGTAQETLTPSAVACPFGLQQDTCIVTMNFSYAHPAGFALKSGDGGVVEAYQASFVGDYVMYNTTANVRVVESSSSITTASDFIPDGSVIFGIFGKITTAFTGASGGLNVGDGSDADRWAAALGKTLGTTFGPTNYTGNPIPATVNADTAVVVTCVSSNCTAGIIQITATLAKPVGF